MSDYICKSCYRISKEKVACCPKCGATESFVLLDEFAVSRSPMSPVGPVGAGTGGIMPKGVEELLPPLPVGGGEAEKEVEKKRSRRKDEKGVRKVVR